MKWRPTWPAMVLAAAFLWAAVGTARGAPVITAQPTNVVVAVGGDALFSVTVTGAPPISFQWFFVSGVTGNPSPVGSNSPTLHLTNVQPADAGGYGVLVQDLSGSVTSVVAQLTVSGLAAPVITRQPASQSAPLGAQIVFTVEATGTDPLYYQWQFNDADIAGARDRVLVLPTVTSNQAGNYRVAVMNSDGSVLSDEATLTLYANEMPFADNFTNPASLLLQTNYARGHCVNFGATREPSEPWHDGKRGYHSVWISWHAPADGIVTMNTFGSEFDTLLAVYVGTSLTNLVAVAGDDDDDSSAGPPNPFGWSRLQFNAIAGTVYHIAVDGMDGSQGNITFECSFDPTADRLPCFQVLPPFRVVKSGDPLCLQFTPCAASLQAINWFFNDQALSTGVSAMNCISNATEAQVGSYQVELQTGTQSSRSPRFEIQFNSLGLTNVMARDKFLDSLDFMQTAGEQILSLRGIAGRGRAPKDGGGTGTSGYTTTQIFSTFGATPEPGEPAHCANGGPYHSKWYAYQAPTNGTLHITTEGSNFDTVLAVYIGPGTDFGTLTNVGCNDNASPAVTWSDVTLPATSNTIYYIAVDGANSSATGLVHLNINLGDPVMLLASPASAVVPPGTSPSFGVTVSGMTNFTYSWRSNGMVIATGAGTPSTGSTITLTNVQAGQSGSFDVVVQNPINTVTSAPAILTVEVAPAITQPPASMALPAGSNALLSVLVSGAPTPFSQWFFNGAVVANQTNLTLGITNFQLALQGRYFLWASNLAGTARSADAELWLVGTQSLFVKVSHTNGAFRMRIASPDSSNRVVEASTTLTNNWVPLLTNTGIYGILDFVDLSATNFAWRFYRARTP